MKKYRGPSIRNAVLLAIVACLTRAAVGARSQSLTPVPDPILWGAGGTSATTLIGTGTPIAPATGWDQSGDYLYSTTSQIGLGNGAGVAIGSYVTSETAGITAVGNSAPDNAPVYYFNSSALGFQMPKTQTTNAIYFVKAQAMKDLYIFGSAGSGSVNITSMSITFAGGATYSVGSWTMANWNSGATGAAGGGYGYGNPSTGAANDGGANQYIYQYAFALPQADWLPIANIVFTKGSSTGNLNIMGVSGSAVTPAPPSIAVAAAGMGATFASLLRARWRRQRA